MRTVIFAGPTISEGIIHEILPEAIVLHPAEHGDVDFARRVLRADVIGLVDGLHTNRLSVLHKEILHVLEDGCRFIGAASMGALRAVECEPWGSEPIGEVAGWYKNGTIDGDDEVCLAHGDKASGYRQLSLPLVNVRASLKAAQLAESRQQEIVSGAQGIFYAERTWKAVFDAAKCSSTEQEQILACELDIKAADALHLCYHISSLPECVLPESEIRNSSKGYGGVFLRNDRKMWNGKKVLRQYEMAFPCFRDQALNRALALGFCKLVGISETAPETDVIPNDDLDATGFKKLRDEEATLARAREWLSGAGSGFLDVPLVNDFLRITGMYKNVKESIK